ncbi:MAG: glycoside hydrolase family 65 protein [Candidatus Omnitrophota bacterium]
MYTKYKDDELWLINENGWARRLQNIRESQFTLGNGYLSSRGILEEMPYNSRPGTYIAGIYDKISAQVDELVNLPNPVNFKFSIGGQKLDMFTMDVLEHKRTLNLKKGMLLRRTIYRDRHKRKYDYQSLRFMSMHNKHIGVMQVALTALDQDCVIDVETGIDTSVSNVANFSEGRKRHFRIRELGQEHKAGYLVAETSGKKYILAYWSGFYYKVRRKNVFARDNVFRINLKKNKSIIFTKIFCIKHFPYKEKHDIYKAQTFKIFQDAFRTDFNSLADKHCLAWEKSWKKADIVIEGTADLQKNLRFNIYHMLICAQNDEGFSSAGARTLSGEGYRGHIFWDADIFLLPFYLFKFPSIAKSMLLYRYRRLEESRKLAKKEGYKGAKFAWESATTGEEETPEWARDIDGTVTKVSTHKMEHHITADIAYAVYKYYIVSGDEAFMERYGYELIFEAARFWASRVEYNKKNKKHEINHIIGPDEFHVDVNNNAFTNMMAKWNLLIAQKLFFKIKNRRAVFSKFKNRLGFCDKEAKTWKRIAVNLKINTNKNNVIEQFDGYFKLRKIGITKTDENGIPLIPLKLKPKDIAKTQLIKQADVLMLIYLLNDVFSAKTKRVNYDFYVGRTVHKSSLSPAIYAILGCETEDFNRAYNLFNVALRADISNLYGNTHEGIHAASLGGTWQVVVFGFAGVSVRKEKLFINPKGMPWTWGKLSFSFTWKKSTIILELSRDEMKVKIISVNKQPVELGIYDTLRHLKSGRSYTFKRKVSRYRKEYFYY